MQQGKGKIKWDNPKLICLGIPEANGQCANGSDAGSPPSEGIPAVCSGFGESASGQGRCANGYNAIGDCPNGFSATVRCITGVGGA